MDRSSGVLRRCTWRRRGIGYGDQRAVDVSGREGGFEPAISRSRTECPTGLSSVLPNDGPALRCVATLSRPRSSSCHRGADLARTSSKPRHHRQTATEQATELGFGRCPQILREWVQICAQAPGFGVDRIFGQYDGRLARKFRQTAFCPLRSSKEPRVIRERLRRMDTDSSEIQMVRIQQPVGLVGRQS